ncbi:hypothetical protein SCHPADRAFT_932417 [Schizopora paradoxa]|uniref:SET domain-containing protein n=1 Tax=Schizopora paradoxa TaxID=27342 RepID=A0A0H2R6K7_9AGAM|nr:hypothetical protein SCHPADRAFT_932417 [Schizopora paradoxa]
MDALDQTLRSLGLDSPMKLKSFLDSLPSQQTPTLKNTNGTTAHTKGCAGPFSIDQVLSVLPKKKLTRDDFMVGGLKELKEQADIEASLLPKRVPLVNRRDLLDTIEATREAMSRTTPDHRRVVRVLVQWPQKYSTTSLEDLSRIHVSDLMVRKTHKGNYLLCRTICTPSFDGGIGLLLGIEDPNGNPAYLKISNHPLLFDADDKDSRTIFPVGIVLALREPTYYTNENVKDLPFIKVESPSDIIAADSDASTLDGVSWKSKLTVQSRARTGEAWKAEGLKDFKASRWFSSAVCFTNSIKFGFDIEVSRLNRAEVYLRLGWNNSALHDAQVALESGRLSDELKRKANVRKIKALYAMGRYQEISQMASTLENDKIFAEWVTRANQRIEEQNTGNYDWLKLHMESKKGLYYSPDIADFTGPVEVKTNAKGLRGTFVTRDVRAGELLMFHKPAFSISTSETTKANDLGFDWINLPALRRTNDRDLHRLFLKAMQRVWDDRHLYDTLRTLYGGETAEEPKAYPAPFVVSPPLEHSTRPIVDIDIEYLHGVTMFNAFGVQDGHALYVAPSLMNHSCMPNARREFIGTAIVIRTIQDLKKGEEVTVSYIDAQVSYDERRFRLMNSWRFNCSCGVCEADDEDGYEARESRRALSKKMDDLEERIDMTYDPVTAQRLAAEAKKTIDNMKRTYHEEHAKKAEGCKYELAKPLRLLADALGVAGRLTSDKTLIKQSIEAKMQSLEVLGLKITDKTLTGALPKGKIPSPVDTSRVPQFYDEMEVETVLEISRFFKELGDKKRAKRWFKVAAWMESVYSGGGIEILKVRQAPSLGLLGLSDLY